MIVAGIICKYIRWAFNLGLVLCWECSLYLLVSLVYVLTAGNVPNLPEWEYNAFRTIELLREYW